MTDNVQPVKNNQQIRCMALKSVGDQQKRGNSANKLPKRKERKKKQNQEMSNQKETLEEDATLFEKDKTVEKDEPRQNGRGIVIDMEI
jgi:hypothetical protein